MGDLIIQASTLCMSANTHDTCICQQHSLTYDVYWVWQSQQGVHEIDDEVCQLSIACVQHASLECLSLQR